MSDSDTEPNTKKIGVHFADDLQFEVPLHCLTEESSFRTHFEKKKREAMKHEQDATETPRPHSHFER